MRSIVGSSMGRDDDFDDAPGAPTTQGRFADITKSADISMQMPGMPTRLCIRDTPGVNDTFMMREQITINAIRDSRLCVVVLSAHQALTSMDMALVRLIANVKSRDVLIFVNRIDELAHPATEVDEIRTRILETLAAHHGPANPQVIFGSALWANASLRGKLDTLPKDSAAALLDWAAVAARPTSATQSTAEIIWDLSGVPALYSAISDRVVDGVGAESLQKIARNALNLGQAVQAGDRLLSFDLSRKRASGLSTAAVVSALDDLETACMSTLPPCPSPDSSCSCRPPFWPPARCICRPPKRRAIAWKRPDQPRRIRRTRCRSTCLPTACTRRWSSI